MKLCTACLPAVTLVTMLLLGGLTGCSDTAEKTTVTGVSTKATVCIDANLCVGCVPRYCYESCPQRAISEFIIDGKNYVYIIDPEKCVSCGVCVNKCPYNAVVWKR